MTKPVKPKRLDDLIAEGRRYGTNAEYPCLECKGYGRVYDPDDPPCPIEGNKMRNRIACPSCRGAGGTVRQAWIDYRKRLLADYRVKMERWTRLSKAWKELRLTRDQIDAIKEFGLHNVKSPGQ